MPSFDLIPLLVQTGYAGLFVFLLTYVLRREKAREDEWARERAERHAEFMRIHEAHLKIQTDTIEAINGLKSVLEQVIYQNRPPFTDPPSSPKRRHYEKDATDEH